MTRDVPADRHGEKRKHRQTGSPTLRPLSPGVPRRSSKELSDICWLHMSGHVRGRAGNPGKSEFLWGGGAVGGVWQAAKSRRKEVGDAKHGVPVGGFNQISVFH